RRPSTKPANAQCPAQLVQLWRLRLREILEPTSLGHPDRGGHTSTMNGVTTGAGRRGLALRRRRLHQQLGLLARQEDMTDLLAVRAAPGQVLADFLDHFGGGGCHFSLHAARRADRVALLAVDSAVRDPLNGWL